MTIQSFFQKYHKPISDGPEHIVLDTTRPMKDFWLRIQDLPDLVWDEEESYEHIVNYILQVISFESRAHLELSYACVDIIQHLIDTPMAERASLFANTVSALGTYIIDQLQQLRAYRNGYLFYQFAGLVGSDLILARFKVDPDPRKLEFQYD